MNIPSHLFKDVAYVVTTKSLNIKGDVEVVDGTRTAFNCRIQILTGEEALRQGGDKSKYMGKVYCSPDVVVTEKDNIEFQGVSWDINSVREPDYMGVYKVIDIERPIVVTP